MDELRSCKQLCQKKLPGGKCVHGCQRLCHPGECLTADTAPCTKRVYIRCPCKAKKLVWALLAGAWLSAEVPAPLTHACRLPFAVYQATECHLIDATPPLRCDEECKLIKSRPTKAQLAQQAAERLAQEQELQAEQKRAAAAAELSALAASSNRKKRLLAIATAVAVLALLLAFFAVDRIDFGTLQSS